MPERLVFQPDVCTNTVLHISGVSLQIQKVIRPRRINHRKQRMTYRLVTLVTLLLASTAASAQTTPLNNKDLFAIAKLSQPTRAAFTEEYLNKVYSGKLSWAGKTMFKQPLTQENEMRFRFSMGWADSVYCNADTALTGGLTPENGKDTDVFVTGKVFDFEIKADGAVLRVFLKDCEAHPSGEETKVLEFEIPDFD